MLLCVTIADAVEPAHGDVFADNGRRISDLIVTQDESSGHTDHAVLTLHNHASALPGGGWLTVSSASPVVFRRLRVDAYTVVLTAQHRPSGDTETFQTRVDRNAPRQWEADIMKQDYPEDEGRTAHRVRDHRSVHGQGRNPDGTLPSNGPR